MVLADEGEVDDDCCAEDVVGALLGVDEGVLDGVGAFVDVGIMTPLGVLTALGIYGGLGGSTGQLDVAQNYSKMLLAVIH